VQRALRFDGLFPTRVPNPETLAELSREIHQARPPGSPFDLVVGLAPGTDPAAWAEAGATWAVTDFGIQPPLAEVREAIDAGPGAC
jgi:hypothetical protein